MGFWSDYAKGIREGVEDIKKYNKLKKNKKKFKASREAYGRKMYLRELAELNRRKKKKK